jgi:hypothetical protein
MHGNDPESLPLGEPYDACGGSFDAPTAMNARQPLLFLVQRA